MKRKHSGTLLLKSIIYRPYSELITFFIAWTITGEIELSIAIGIADLIIKIFTYFFFDLFWEKFIKVNYSPCVIWLTGLSGAGKTTIANSLLNNLQSNDTKCIILDGDDIRAVFPTGFDKVSRIKHNISVGEMATLLERQRYVVIVSLVSPFLEARDKCREIANNFIEVHISTSLMVCEKRDVKGLYSKARKGEIKEFTGIDSPYEPPIHPEVILDTELSDLNFCVRTILNKLKNGRTGK